MRKEYDFSNGERGKFFNKDVSFNIPIYLEQDIYSDLLEIAKMKNTEVNYLVNNLLREDIKLANIVK